MLDSFFDGFRLQPILKIGSNGSVDSYAFEVLSSPCKLVSSIDDFFLTLPKSLYRALITVQVNLFSKKKQNFFINIPVFLLQDKDFMLSLSGYRLSNLNFEIQDSHNLLGLTFEELASLADSISQLKLLGAKTWIDDIDDQYLDIALKLGVNGVKLDKDFVWHSPNVSEVVSDFQEFGLDVLAEGIESAYIFSKVVSSKVDFVQGYLWPEINISLDGRFLF
ncbi:histidine kinase [Vibrio cholerae]|uniref:EAL domain-containing protein n=1 Tax=Vibrio TaxID=662 RepID=UPI0015EFB479|nr:MULTISPECIES: EAL domain-containing protein [Vibrio]GHX29407.1 histidine kinase [Vibrio cholerae]GHY08188.1 histidine kinase [Vibrio cholerae]GHY65829.1 histidine kinase [Vibrio cholerae]